MYENEETSIENNDNLSEESSESAQIQNGENENQDILENDNSETLQEADTEPNDTLMVDVVGIRFKKAGKVYSFDPSGFELKTGDNVIVETARGMEVGQVARTVVKVFESMVNKPLKPVVRMATSVP